MASIRSLQPWLYPWAAALLRVAASQGWHVTVTSCRRSYSQQARLYRAFLAGHSEYPAAPPGHSLHEVGRAFDLAGVSSQLEQLGAVWESWGGTYGKKFNDPIHFEA